MMINDDIAAEVREQLKEMVNPVKLVHFTQVLNLEYGAETRQLLEEVTALSPKLSLEVYDFTLDKEKVAEYRIDKVPATAIRGIPEEEQQAAINGAFDYGIRYYGFPAGYEFSSLLEAIVDVSKRDSGLSPKSREELKAVTAPLHLEVFVTPT